MGGIPIDEAELLATMLEGILYGFSSLIFFLVVWSLLGSRKSARHMVWARGMMFMVAFLMLLLSTAHIVINITRMMEGLILKRKTYPGGPIAFFSRVPQWSFLAANYVLIVQSWIAGAFLLSRCYVAWKSMLITLLPTFFWCTSFATGIGSMYAAARAGKAGVFEGVYQIWTASFWATTLATNLLTAFLLGYRIWYLDWNDIKSLDSHPRSRLVVRIIIDAGSLYSVTLFVLLICFLCENNGQFVVVGMLSPIMAITFYTIIICIGLAHRQQFTDLPLSFARPELSASRGADEVRVTRVHIPAMAQCETEQGKDTFVDSSTTENKRLTDERKFDGDKEAV